MKDVFEHIERLNREENFWIVSRETGEFLVWMIRVLGAERVLEIGTGIGYSGIIMGRELRGGGGRLVTIESNSKRFEMASGHFEEAGLKGVVEQVKGHVPEVILEGFSEGDFDMMFFDATKYEHCAHFDAVWPLLKEGGVIVVDNATSHSKELASFFGYVKGKSDVECGVLPIGTGVFVVLKKKE